MTVIRGINSIEKDLSVIGTLIMGVRSMGCTFWMFTGSHVRGEDNFNAHSLARLAFHFEGLLAWMEKAPPQVSYHVAVDLGLF